jgi:hypothetical protein
MLFSPISDATYQLNKNVEMENSQQCMTDAWRGECSADAIQVHPTIPHSSTYLASVSRAFSLALMSRWTS